MAYLFLEQVLKEKYGSLLTALKQQHSLKQDQYPMTLEEAVQMLNAHDWDKRKINPNKSKQNNNDKKNSDTEISNKTEAMTDEPTIMSGLTFAQMEGSCYCCDKRGHLSSRCPEKSKPQSEWAANKTKEVIHAQQAKMEYSPGQITRNNTGWLK